MDAAQSRKFASIWRIVRLDAASLGKSASARHLLAPGFGTNHIEPALAKRMDSAHYRTYASFHRIARIDAAHYRKFASIWRIVRLDAAWHGKSASPHRLLTPVRGTPCIRPALVKLLDAAKYRKSTSVRRTPHLGAAPYRESKSVWRIARPEAAH